ncbi:hypothetical protein BSR29_07790 [Boudabousia liubingyangii]|uniref:DUF3017 domain-containing protein n=1 Tax=Boudabousia liubingyangii TaxID=1921764 RepID=A0A1Q5PJN3_9ACTO|nr:hypothetical protein [Boudabousia liubingyangii]OKL46147.1 hypothetical protein BSR29_07790 [Boudabousia liubingyangii]OKL46296.1 hypothetical protein BSR28_07085 [Boudabousia liubingyangii]
MPDHRPPRQNYTAALILVCALVLTVVVAIYGSVKVAIYMLALICAVNAVSRLIYRSDQAWNAGKNWRFDAIFYGLLALGLVILAPMSQIGAS